MSESTRRPLVVHVTREELEAERAAIQATHPQIEAIRAEATCCSGCKPERVRERLGHDAADAAARLSTIEFLLDERPPMGEA